MDAVHKFMPDAEAGAGSLAAPPAFDLARPSTLSTPLVFASPHSGRFYPPAMMAASVLDDAAIRRSEDAYVDALVGQAAAHGVPLIAARYARAYIDVNREPYELDPAMFEDELPAFACARTARVAAGLGSIARVVAEGQEIYRGKLTFGDAKARIEQVHRPYHVALQALLEETRTAFGTAILIDWHSMPSAATGGGAARAADFVLGDRFGAACSRRVTEVWERELNARGYRVARNAPYAGGHTTEFYGKPERGVHALQIEINRGLYLDERSLEPNKGFAGLERDLGAVFDKLAVQDWSRLP
jgi:N-formylglutamate amidohydrolase